MLTANAVCLLMLVVFAVGAFLINVVLPIYLIVKIIQWIIQYRETGTLPWHRKLRPPAGEAGTGLKAALEREKNAASQQQPAAVKAAEPAAAVRPSAQYFESRRKEELYAGLKQRDRLDRLALVYYVEDALNAGMAPEAVGAALKSKGWPEEIIKSVLPQAA